MRVQRSWIVVLSVGSVWVAGCASDPAPASACPPGQAACGSTCAALASDLSNCGACGVACGDGEVCQAGACAAVCGSPLVSCATPAGARCVDLERDTSHCGACGVICAVGELCTAGACANPCGSPEWRLCGERCRQITADARHCGGCDAGCGPGDLCHGGACVAPGTAAAPRLVVSVTADDGIGTQADHMVPILEAHGMRGSFYVIVGRIDLPDTVNFTREELRAMSRAGHEIGLHGLTHTRDATRVTPAERVRREICDGRVSLLARGFEVRSMAYPFGESDAVSRGAAQACGLGAARNVGGVATTGLPAAETFPPADRYALRAPSSVKLPHDVALLQRYVTDAEATGGWLFVNFHHVRPLADCISECFPAEWFGEWLDWLAPRAAAGTVVRTVEQLIGGDVAPAVASGTPPMILGGMESHLAGVDAPPDCWTIGGGATVNATTSTASVPGRTGAAVQVRVDPWIDGSHTLIQDRGSTNSPDYRSCGTQVVPGRTYAFRCWVRADVPVRLLLYANDDVTHRVASWMQGAWLDPSPATWTELSVTATVPAALNTVFIGPSLTQPCSGAGCVAGEGTATMLVDDCEAVEVGG